VYLLKILNENIKQNTQTNQTSKTNRQFLLPILLVQVSNIQNQHYSFQKLLKLPANTQRSAHVIKKYVNCNHGKLTKSLTSTQLPERIVL